MTFSSGRGRRLRAFRPNLRDTIYDSDPALLQSTQACDCPALMTI
jgi:hypothetical protein